MQPSNGMVKAGRADCGSCPAELALIEVQNEKAAREKFDAETAVNVDRLADAVTALALKLEGVGALVSNLQGTCVEQAKTLTQYQVEIAKLGNVKYWIAAIVAGVELARTQGFGALLHSLGAFFQ